MAYDSKPLFGKAFRFGQVLGTTADPDVPVTNALATGEVQYKLFNNGAWGSYTNVTTLPTVTADGDFDVVLAAGEMLGEIVRVKFEWVSSATEFVTEFADVIPSVGGADIIHTDSLTGTPTSTSWVLDTGVGVNDIPNGCEGVLVDVSAGHLYPFTGVDYVHSTKTLTVIADNAVPVVPSAGDIIAISSRRPLRPVEQSRTLDVSPAGAADADVVRFGTSAVALESLKNALTGVAGETLTIDIAGSVASVGADGISAASIQASALNGKGDWNIGKTGYSLVTTPPTAAVIADAVWDELVAEHLVAGSFGLVMGMQAVAYGTITTVTSSTQFLCSLNEAAANNTLRGCWLRVNGIPGVRYITDYDSDGGGDIYIESAFSDMTGPQAGDKIVVYQGSFVQGINGTLKTLDDLDTAQDAQHLVTQNKIDDVASGQVVTLPENFDAWDIPEVTIVKTGLRQYRAYVDETDLIPTTAETFYVDDANGNDGNDGLTLANAFATFEAAIAASAGVSVEFRCTAGTYTINSALPSTSCIIRREGGGEVKLQSVSGEVTTATGSNVYLENVTFLDRLESTDGTRYLKNIAIEVPSGDGLWLHGTGKAILVGTRNNNTTVDDAIDFDDTVQAIEIDSIITGTDSTATDNCSTAHNDARVVRVNCEYANSPRPVHDVNRAKSVNLGCRVSNSTGAAGETTQFLLGAGLDTIANEDVHSWVFGCKFSGTTTVDLYSDDQSWLYVDEETDYATAASTSQIATIPGPTLKLTGADGVVISTDTARAIADEVLSRSVSNVEGASLDEHTLGVIILAILESARTDSTWTIKRTTGATQVTKTLTLDASADPVIGVD